MVAGEGDFGLQDHKTLEEARERAWIPLSRYPGWCEARAPNLSFPYREAC